MNKLKILATTKLILLSLFAHIAVASEQNSQINEIMEKTGFTELVKHVPEFAQRTLKQSSGALDPEVNSALSKAFTQAFATSSVQKDIVAVLKSHYDEEKAKAYLDKLQLPLSSKIAALERQTNNPANQEAIMNFAKQDKSKQASTQRLEQIERLDRATRITEFGVDMQTAFFKAVFTAVNPILDADMKIDSKEMERMVDEVRRSFNESYTENTRLSYLFAFRNLSDEELDEYITLCESEDYRWGVQMLGNAMIVALNKAAERAAIYMTQASNENI